MHYVAIVDGIDSAYGVTFPDLLGCTAMGETIDEALENAVEALRAWVEAMSAMDVSIPEPRSVAVIRQDPEVQEALAEGAILASVVLVRRLSRPVKANLSLDSGILAAIDATATKLGITRSAMVERLALERISEFA